ncbi:cobalt-zinc-cadmium resistance protein CzcA [Lysobacter sp. yr284]|uniref:efflux RND transporter permease subunit n=1 Tax=Lysobacter sp. yr284 TaxID=1761791 RepID=UPI00089535AF|nr:CusA/CzcA family heavy metal efflux RND transporter [Lysobacter sp. yr284]SDY81097.1 cobalt-zinc-cadmium resistance protein CzcA [Lysobacter sp. yr284]
MLDRIIDACVHRRTAILVMTAIVALFGVRAYLQTPIEAYPDVTNVQVQVITQMPGYAAEEIERQVTVPLERALNGTPGMTLLRSESLFGLSLVTLIFDDDVDAFSTRMLVSQRMAQAELPQGVVPDLAPEATPLGKIYRFRLVSDRADLYQLRSEMQWNVTRVLRQVQGVADVVPFGGYLKELQVEADPAKLYAAGLGLGDLEEAIKQANLNVGGGFLRHGDQELTVRGVGFIDSVEDIKAIPLKSRAGTALTVGDVASIKLAATPRRGSVAYNDQGEVVEGLVLMRRGENPSRVLEGVHEKVAELNAKILPAGMKIVASHDRSVLVGHTLSTVHDNLLHGFILVVAIVWLFMRSITGSAVVAVVIPLSLLVAFIGLHFLGLPANLISMGAIDFGILVDGAVVLVENVIHAIRHEKPPNRKALVALVIRSATAVGRPTFFAMLIIIAALLPVFTLQSVEGRIFRPLALTYAFALVGALVFSLTVVPALCALLFKPEHAKLVEPGWIAKLRDGYKRLLQALLQRRAVPLALAAALLVAGGFATARLGTEFLPELDEGDIFVFAEMPASVSMEKGQQLLMDVHKRVLAFPEVSAVHTEHGRPEDGTDNEGVNMLKTFVSLKPDADWRADWDKPRLIQAMRESLEHIPGVRFNFSQPIKDSVEEAVSGVRGKVVLKVFGPDLERMRETLKQAKAVLQEVPGVTELDLYRDVSSPQLRIRLDRTALARAGIPVETAAATIETALAGRVVTDYWEGERPVPVRLLLPRPSRDDEDKIADLTVPAPGGAQIPLRQLATIEIGTGVASIVREGNIRFLALKFNVQGRDMGSTVKDAIAAVQAKVKAPDGHYFVWGGEFENQARAAQRLKLVVPVAIVLVLGLLYAAMNSGRSALAIMATMPFALTGGAFALLLAGIPLSVSAAIGFIALLGQVSLMGVLVLSAAEDRRRAGEDLLPALLEGAAERLRPVLMASLLALFGLLPMALSSGMGSETQRPFALVVVGGMTTTLLVALFVLPALYSLIAAKRLQTPEEADA